MQSAAIKATVALLIAITIAVLVHDLWQQFVTPLQRAIGT